MDDENRKLHISQAQTPTDFTLDDILAEFGSAPDGPADDARDSLGDRSKKLVLEQLPAELAADELSALDNVISDAIAQPAPASPDFASAGFESAAAPTPAFPGAGFEQPGAENALRFDDPESVIAEALLEFGSYARQAEAEVAASEPQPDPEPEPEPELEPEPGPEPEEGAADAVAAAVADAVAADETAPEDAAEELVRFDDPEAVIAEALLEYGSASEYSDDDGSTDYASVNPGFEAPPEAASAGFEPAAASDDEADAEAERDEADTAAPAEKRRDERSAKERFLSPIVALLALLALKRAQRQAKQRAEETAAQDADALPEPPPEKAARAAAAQLRPLKTRGRIALGVSAVMVYLTYAAASALPLTGALKSSPRVFCLMLLILELTVMMAGLNIFTDGVVHLCKGKPDAQSLVALSCVFTALDAVALAVFGDGAFGLPLCAASAIGMTVAIWGEYWRCSALRRSFQTLSSTHNLYAVTGERGITKEAALLKSRRSVDGFIRRSLEPDFSAGVFRLLTPMLAIAAVVLGALCALLRGVPKAILHDISMLAAASSAFSVTLCFSLPFAFAARRFSTSGAAVAGWPGIRDIGRSRNVVITDSDVFPKGTLELGDIRILEGAFVDKVISATASVIAASGSGLALPFAELIRRNGYTISRVENFEPHDGGGMTAMVDGETVYVGNTGFMNLMGVRVPRKLGTHNAICTAMNGSLVGIFFVNYRATGGVQDALVTLLHSNLEPIFALRDFNITPTMLRDRFRLPSENFKFPSYAERFRISGAQPDKRSLIAAAVAREGMEPLVDAADRGRRLYHVIRIGTFVTAASCVFGLLMMFLLCWTKTFDVATASNVVTFMLLWLIPSVVITWGVAR